MEIPRTPRSSVFRNIHGVPLKDYFRDTVISKDAEGGAQIAVAFDHLVYASHPKGVASALALASAGGKDVPMPKLMLHNGGITDMRHSPFYPSVLATCGGEGDLRLTVTDVDPETLNLNMHSPHLIKQAHERRAVSVSWNPVASNVLCSAGGDNKIRLWDLEQGVNDCELDVVAPWHAEFQGDGRTIISMDKERVMSIHDPRGKGQRISSAPLFTSNKPCRCASMGSLDPKSKTDTVILAIGFEGMGQKRLKVFDARKLDEPLTSLKVPGGSGLPFLHWDATARILFLTSRGESACHVFEMIGNDLKMLPEHKFLKQASNTAFLPKAAVDTSRNEIARAYRTEVESKTITQTTFVVGRQGEGFQSELYGCCPTGEPGLTAADWFAGHDAAVPTAAMHLTESEGEVQFPSLHPENTAVVTWDASAM